MLSPFRTSNGEMRARSYRARHKDLDWPLFRQTVEDKMEALVPENKTEYLVSIITQVLDELAPKRAIKEKTQPRWWNESLQMKKNKIRRLSKRKYLNPSEKRQLEELDRNFRKEIRKAKRDSFRKFSSSGNSASDLSGLMKTLNVKPTSTALIRNKRGALPYDYETSHNNLLTHHFPEHQDTPPPPPT